MPAHFYRDEKRRQMEKEGTCLHMIGRGLLATAVMAIIGAVAGYATEGTLEGAVGGAGVAAFVPAYNTFHTVTSIKRGGGLEDETCPAGIEKVDPLIFEAAGGLIDRNDETSTKIIMGYLVYKFNTTIAIITDLPEKLKKLSALISHINSKSVEDITAEVKHSAEANATAKGGSRNRKRRQSQRRLQRRLRQRSQRRTQRRI